MDTSLGFFDQQEGRVEPWIVLLVPVSKFVFDRYIIAREEAYLERAFGEVYLDYKRTVRRWL